ncbi:hypothetical protein BDV98DRAFT_604009 [Pterulicium gracile]|uniref:Chromo domain-containing protein n=1 Tax=Pterulicium gracile TaxID=1884261 RepID=A0A5C3QP15_9AGAR|nr:hypothetical protein BDV98DRAFT_604009 [Pterula gracilis]
MAVSEAASQRPISSTKKSRPGSAEDPPQTDEDDKMEGSGDDGEEEEEEYEIEKILDAKRDKFGPGKTGYLVSWKGYGPSENSWVSEEDASNAQDLISVFWKDRKEKEGREAAKKDSASAKSRAGKAVSSKASTSRARTARKSEPAESDAGGESASVAPAPKKRGRASKAATKSASAEVESEDEADTQTKRRKRADSVKTESELAEEDFKIGNMKKYMHLKSWEHLVQQVETVERPKEGSIMVFFTLNSGERIREEAGICGDKFPKSMLRFYESNLRWRTGNDDDEVY